MRLFILFLAFFSSHVLADDAFWWHTNINGQHFTSASAACSDWASKNSKPLGTPNSNYIFETSVSNVQATQALCNYKYNVTYSDGSYIPGASYNASTHVYRQGDCPSGTTYDTQTGECKGDPCLPTIGQLILHEHEFRNLTQDGNPDVDPPPSICSNSCQYAHDFGTFKVRRDKDSFFGGFKYKGNGVTCTGGDPSGGNSNFDQPPQQPPQTEEKEYIKDSSCEGWVTNPDGTTTRSCFSRNYFNEPGNMNCGSMGGAYDCTAGNPSPYEKDEVTEKTDTKTNNPDGSSTTKSDSSTTTTTCKGMSKCTSTGKNETSTEGTNADGTEGDKSSNCTGDGCASDDEDKEGEEGEEEQEEEPERTAGNTSCNGATAVVSCSGDAIDCAVLQEEANQSCMAKEQADFPGKKGDIEGMFQGEQFTLQETEIAAPSFINASTRFLPAACPPPKVASVSSNGGQSLSFNYDPICQVATDLSWIIVAIASIWAAAYVGRAFGGE